MLLSRAVNNAALAAYSEDRPLEERLGGVFDLLRYGYTENAREVIEHINQTKSWLQRVEWLSRACERTEILSDGVQPGQNGVEHVAISGLPNPISIRLPSDTLMVRSPKAHRLMVAFGGATEAFWLVAPFLDLVDCHLVVLRDPKRLFHLAGVSGLGGTYAECVAALTRMATSLGVTEIYTAGSSSGGYSALRYALDLGARGVLTFCPITGSDDIAAEVERYPGLRAIARKAPEMMLDIVPMYRAAANPPKVIIAFGDKNPLDVRQAMRMKDLPGVSLEPLPGLSTHPVWSKLLSDHRFEDLLNRLLAS